MRQLVNTKEFSTRGPKSYEKSLDPEKYRSWYVPYSDHNIVKRMVECSDSEYEDMVRDVVSRVRMAILMPHVNDKEIIQRLAKKLGIMIVYDPRTGYMEVAARGKRNESLKRMTRHGGRMMNLDNERAFDAVQREIARGEW